MGYIPAQQARKVFTTVLANIYQDFIEAPSFLTSFAKKETYSTKTVQTLARRGTEKIAVDVIRGSKGNLNQITRFSQNEYLPPYYKEKVNVSAMNIYDIPFESGDSYNTAQIDALARSTATALDETKKKVDRAIELQMAQLLQTGVIEISNGDNIDYNRNAEMIEVLTGDELWDSSVVDIFKFFEDKGTKLRTIGKVGGGQSVNVVMGMLAWQAFRSNKDVKDGDNFYTKSALEFTTNPIFTASGGSYKGTLKVGIYNYDIWVYDEVYDNANDVSTRYWDSSYVCLIPQSFQAEISFCQVPMLPAWVRQNPRSSRVFRGLNSKMQGFTLFDYVHEEDEVYYAGIKAAPLAQLISVDRVYTAKVLEGGGVVG
jgi:hypothetical protein